MVPAITTPVTWAQAREMSHLSIPVKAMVKRYLQLASIDKRYLAGGFVLVLFLGLYCISNGGHQERKGEVGAGAALLILGGVLGYATYLGEKVREEMHPSPEKGRPILARLLGVSLPLNHAAADAENDGPRQDPDIFIDDSGRCTPYHLY